MSRIALGGNVPFASGELSCQANLLEIILALRPPGRLTRRLDSWQQQGHGHAWSTVISLRRQKICNSGICQQISFQKPLQGMKTGVIRNRGLMASKAT